VHELRAAVERAVADDPLRYVENPVPLTWLRLVDALAARDEPCVARSRRFVGGGARFLSPDTHQRK